MGRPKQFDPDVALVRAYETFREQGYAATSTNDLADAMGIGRGSLYASFGTKEEVFRKAFLRYREETFDRVAAMIRGSEDPLGAIRGFLESNAKRHGEPYTRYGCLIVNSTVELGPHDGQFAEALRKSWATIGGAYEDAIRRAQEAGDVDAGQDAAVLARFLVTVTRGLAVDAKLDPKADAAMGAVDLAMSVVTRSAGS